MQVYPTRAVSRVKLSPQISVPLETVPICDSVFKPRSVKCNHVQSDPPVGHADQTALGNLSQQITAMGTHLTGLCTAEALLRHQRIGIRTVDPRGLETLKILKILF